MLGITYFATLSFQHFFCLGLFFIVVGEMAAKRDESVASDSISLQISTLGFVVLNCSLLQCSFSEELLLMHLVFCFSYLVLYFLRPQENTMRSSSSNLSVYVFLVLLMVVELVD